VDVEGGLQILNIDAYVVHIWDRQTAAEPTKSSFSGKLVLREENYS
jgi:hypothetical protein